MKRPIQFYPNTNNDARCVQAVMRMVLAHNKIYRSYSYLDELTGRRGKQFTWDMQAVIGMAKLGFKSHIIDSTDYEKLAGKDWKQYLRESWETEEEYAWQASKTRLMARHRDAGIILDLQERGMVTHEKQEATATDANWLLNKGWYVMAATDRHVVLLTDMDHLKVVFHNPGLPPKPSVRMKRKDFMKIFGKSIVAWRLA